GGAQRGVPKAAAALVGAHPDQLDVSAPAPGPAGQPGQQVAVVAADGDGQPEPVVVAGGGGVEVVDLLVQPVVQVSVGAADRELDLARHRVSSVGHGCLTRTARV